MNEVWNTIWFLCKVIIFSVMIWQWLWMSVILLSGHEISITKRGGTIIRTFDPSNKKFKLQYIASLIIGVLGFYLVYNYIP